MTLLGEVLTKHHNRQVVHGCETVFFEEKMQQKKKYYGKILLIGEYAVLSGSQAMTIPFNKKSGYLSFLNISSTEEQIKSHEKLVKFLAFLKRKIHRKRLETTIDLAGLESGIERGLYFHSDIPQGYGVGSSGALVASIYDRFGLIKSESDNEPVKHMETLAEMESYFHGRSSGIDPLSSYLNRPLVFSDEKIEIYQSIKNINYHLFLLDSLKKRNAGRMIRLFLNKYRFENFRKIFNEKLIPANKNAIQALVKGDVKHIQSLLASISDIQAEYFSEMIPEIIRPLWDKGLRTGKYFLKLCGSGGGGYTIGFTTIPKLEFSLDLPLIWI